jgi:hypothetical protein
MLDQRQRVPPGWRPSAAAVSAMAALLRRLAAREREAGQAKAAPPEAGGRPAAPPEVPNESKGVNM